METFTIREAAEACGLTYEALRARVDRGTIRAGKRHEDAARVIPKSELQRIGLLPGDEHGDLRAELDRLRAELKVHRLLTEKAQGETAAEREARERMEEVFHQARAAQQTAEAQHAQLRAEVDELAAAGPIRAWRLRRQLRQATRAAAE